MTIFTACKQMKAQQTSNPTLLFWTFVIAHVVLWTLASSLPRLHLPIDSLEASVWSQHLLWGYEKNPYFNAWVMAAVIKLFQSADWGIYLASRLSVAICFWGLWRLGRQFLNSAYALISVMLLECVQYFTFGALELNDNVLELGLWSLSASYFYTALKKNSLKDWLIVGICLGLGIMTKYYTLLLATSFFVFLLVEPSVRWTPFSNVTTAFISNKSFMGCPSSGQAATRLDHLLPLGEGKGVDHTYGLYLALAIALLICLPHLVWLTQHDFITLKYLQHRLHSTPTWWDHFREPIYFLLAQLANFLPAALIIFFIFGFKNRLPNHNTCWDSFNKKFLLCLSFIPLLLSCLVAVLKGTHLHTLWGQPLPIWWGLLLVSYLQPPLPHRRFQFFVITIFAVMVISSGSYALSMYYAGAKASTNYPGKLIAQDIDALWQQHFPNKPLKYVMGDRWRAGSVSHYSIYHPDVYIELNPAFSPWIDENQLIKHGGVIFWDAETPKFENIPLWFKTKFPQITYGEVRTYYWLRDSTDRVFYIGVALVPPLHS